MTPADVYFGRDEEILKRSEEQKQPTIYRHFRYNLGQLDEEPGEATASYCFPKDVSLSQGC